MNKFATLTRFKKLGYDSFDLMTNLQLTLLIFDISKRYTTAVLQIFKNLKIKIEIGSEVFNDNQGFVR